ncbi:class I SAM-dependent methyltransferase [Brachybacterium sp. GCM10030268]|uniref:class I SAM-dependent methyltransferase n=1 Tax=Brachybacterium sp. GCM10030268 TaxID=3273382 RepID=UPI00360711DE
MPALLEATAPAVSHLDVGCGTGDLALAAARAGRRVVAADPEPDMVALTRRTVEADGAGVSVVGAGAPGLPLPDAVFDAVTANFVVNHVPEPRATIAELARVATPGGRLAMTIWPAEPGPHLAAYGQAARNAGAVPVASTRLPPELDFPRTPHGLADLARGAGLRVESAEEITWTWHITADDLMAGIAGGVATPGQTHRAQKPEVRAAIERRARELWSAYATDGGGGVADAPGISCATLAFPVSAVLVSAVVPVETA